MSKLAAICGLMALFVAPAMAQEQPPSDQNQAPTDQTGPVKAKRTYITPEVELSGGYAYRTYYGLTGTLGMNGWYASADYNLKRWLGVAGEVVDVDKNQGVIQGVPFGDTHIYTFMAGPQIYPLGHHKLTPFGHFLYGAAYFRNVKGAYSGYPGKTITYVVRAWQVGGGLDFNVTQHWGIRLVQADFGSANFVPNTSTFVNRSMRRVSVGIVFRFGER